MLLFDSSLLQKLTVNKLFHSYCYKQKNRCCREWQISYELKSTFAHKNKHLTNYSVMSFKSGLSDIFLSCCLIKLTYS